MSIRTTSHAGYLHVGCDKRGCPANDHEAYDPDKPMEEACRNLYGRLIRHGWTFWASRELRVFCPEHGPSRGSQMRNVTDYYRTRYER
jgi:hypothetical protein